MKFINQEHMSFYYEMMQNAKHDDSYHRALFYTIGICADTRSHIKEIYSRKEDSIKLDCIDAGWQTSGSIKTTLLAFNLYNGFIQENRENASTPYDLFACEFAPCFLEAIKLKYPEYCKQQEHYYPER